MLSEFSTASQILNSNLVFNPWSIGTVCKEIDKALTMPDHERSFRQWRDYKYAIRNPAGSWSRQVVLDVVENYQAQEAKRAAAKDLVRINDIASNTAASMGSPHDSSTAAIIAAYKNAKRRVIVLDYGGTLIERDARETKHGLRTDFSADGYSKAMPKPVMDGLACLSQTTHNTMYVVSGLRSAAIDALHLSHLNGMGLAAENGSFVSHPSHRLQPSLDHHASSGGALAFEFNQSLGSPPPVHTALHSPVDSASQFWPTMGAVPQSQPGFSRSSVRHSTMLSPSRKWIALTPSSVDVLTEWNTVKPRAVAIMNEYQWRVNGSSVRIYESLVAWDFRNADPEWAQAQATHLAEDLESLASDAVKVSIRKSRVEISLREMNKGQFVQQVLNACPEMPDFIMIVGDDVTDEEMFVATERFFQPSEETREDTKTVKSPHPVELPAGVFTVHVGREEKQTRAAYLLPDVSTLQRLVVDLANVTTPDIA
jgi:trehalose-phosphatase